MLKAVARKLLRLFLGDYSAYYVYKADTSRLPVMNSASRTVKAINDAVIREDRAAFARDLHGWSGPGLFFYGCFQENLLAGICVYASGSRNSQQEFWPLKEGEATLLQVITRPDMQNQGVGRTLIGESGRLMMKEGVQTVYARVWHSNAPSLHAFDRSGWKRIALVAEVDPFRSRKPFRLRFKW